MKNIIKPGIFTVIILTLVTSSCKKEPSIAYSDCTHHIVSAHGDFFTTCTMDVNQGADLAKVELNFELKSGAIKWLLRDPYDVVQLEGDVESGNLVIEEHTIQEPVPGNWTFEFHFKDADGEYYSYWNVQ